MKCNEKYYPFCFEILQHNDKLSLFHSNWFVILLNYRLQAHERFYRHHLINCLRHWADFFVVHLILCNVYLEIIARIAKTAFACLGQSHQIIKTYCHKNWLPTALKVFQRCRQCEELLTFCLHFWQPFGTRDAQCLFFSSNRLLAYTKRYNICSTRFVTLPKWVLR